MFLSYIFYCVQSVIFDISKVILNPTVLVIFYSHRNCQRQYNCNAISLTLQISLAYRRIKLHSFINETVLGSGFYIGTDVSTGAGVTGWVENALSPGSNNQTIIIGTTNIIKSDTIREIKIFFKITASHKLYESKRKNTTDSSVVFFL